MEKNNLGRILLTIGIIVLSIALLLNGFEIISLLIFRILIILSIVLEVIGTIFMCNNK